MAKKAYAVVTKILPENSWQLHEICTTEEKAWMCIETAYYKHLNFLLAVDDIIDNIKIDRYSVTVIYSSNLTTRVTTFIICKRPFIE